MTKVKCNFDMMEFAMRIVDDKGHLYIGKRTLDIGQ